MIKPSTNTNKSAQQSAAARAAIAVHSTEVEYDTTNPAWVTFDASITAQLAEMEKRYTGLATPLSLSKKFENRRR
jgi:hypothetical protein